MLARVIRSACRPEPPVGSERPKVRTIGGVSLGMKVDKKELDFGAESAQLAQLCGLNRREGVFSCTSALCRKQGGGPCGVARRRAVRFDADRLARSHAHHWQHLSDC